ncbi:MAG TPA: hypothetical protein VD788_09975, partial [Candidatus Polarisedimenticolaceae bacterium]|nr:hypothetical protein [Candidatus Polarisedimenticolaceae bacterium]
MNTRGFILQADYRVEAGAAVLLLYGKLEGGAGFLIRERRRRPWLYVRRSQFARVADVDGGLCRVDETPPRVTMDGAPVVRLEHASPGDSATIRQRLERAGVETFEA